MPNLKLSDWLNIVFLVIGLVGLYIAIQSYRVAVTQLEQATEDGKEQQKSLDASRAQLQAVVDTAKQQQEVLTQHLETSKAQLALQQELYRQELERASRKPKLTIFVEHKSFDAGKMTTGLVVDKERRTRLPLRIRNTGSAPLKKPIFIAVASQKDITMWFENTPVHQTTPNRAQLGGSVGVMDIPPFSTSKQNWEADLLFSVPAGATSFDVTLDVVAENLDSPFHVVFHVTL